MVRMVDGFGEDHSLGASIGRPSEGDAERAHDECLVETLEVGITRLCDDGTERVARLLEDVVDVGELGQDGGGGRARGAWSILM